MFGILAVIGLGVVLWWISKACKKISIGLNDASFLVANIVEYYNKKPVINNRVNRQNKIAEEKLHNITGEVSNATYTHDVREEIEGLINNLPPISPRP
jgi:hypothetical protein